MHAYRQDHMRMCICCAWLCFGVHISAPMGTDCKLEGTLCNYAPLTMFFASLHFTKCLRFTHYLNANVV